MQRLDVRLAAEREISRETAKRLIIAGNVAVNGKTVCKPSAKLAPEDIISAVINIKYVSRGGYKLEKAVDFFNIELEAKTCMDIGASTGGFSDCMLQNRAVKVFAVDVGHGQLAHKLLDDDRVISIEDTNIKELENFDAAIDFISVDVSFISLTKILPKVFTILKREAYALCLVKPQFEAGRENITKGGIVKNKTVHKKVLATVTSAAENCGFIIKGLTYSAITGMDGNIEYLLYIKKCDDQTTQTALQQTFPIDSVVESAFSNFQTSHRKAESIK